MHIYNTTISFHQNIYVYALILFQKPPLKANLYLCMHWISSTIWVQFYRKTIYLCIQDFLNSIYGYSYTISQMPCLSIHIYNMCAPAQRMALYICNYSVTSLSEFQKMQKICSYLFSIFKIAPECIAKYMAICYIGIKGS